MKQQRWQMIPIIRCRNDLILVILGLLQILIHLIHLIHLILEENVLDQNIVHIVHIVHIIHIIIIQEVIVVSLVQFLLNFVYLTKTHSSPLLELISSFAMSDDKKKVPLLKRMFSSGASALVTKSIVTPFDVVKTYVQVVLHSIYKKQAEFTFPERREKLNVAFMNFPL